MHGQTILQLCYVSQAREQRIRSGVVSASRKFIPRSSLSTPQRGRGFFNRRNTFDLRESMRGMNMMDSNFENRSGSPGGHYSRWPDPWRREDDWGPITAAVMFFIILAGVIVYSSGARP